MIIVIGLVLCVALCVLLGLVILGVLWSVLRLLLEQPLVLIAGVIAVIAWIRIREWRRASARVWVPALANCLLLAGIIVGSSVVLLWALLKSLLRYFGEL